MTRYLVLEVDGADAEVLPRLLEFHRGKSAYLLLGQPSDSAIHLGHGDVLSVRIPAHPLVQHTGQIKGTDIHIYMTKGKD